MPGAAIRFVAQELTNAARRRKKPEVKEADMVKLSRTTIDAFFDELVKISSRVEKGLKKILKAKFSE